MGTKNGLRKSLLKFYLLLFSNALNICPEFTNQFDYKEIKHAFSSK